MGSDFFTSLSGFHVRQAAKRGYYRNGGDGNPATRRETAGILDGSGPATERRGI